MRHMADRCHDTCLEHVETVIEHSSPIHYVADKIQELGCPIPAGWIKCTPCSEQNSIRMSGGFTVDSSLQAPMIIVCENEKLHRQTLEDTLIHELIHAYDVCRAKVDWTNCLHHACTEVRASALSGECNPSREFKRGNFNIQKAYQKCVQRRAIKSVSANPHCRNVAKEAVESVFRNCFSDTAPFSDHSQTMAPSNSGS